MGKICRDWEKHFFIFLISDFYFVLYILWNFTRPNKGYSSTYLRCLSVWIYTTGALTETEQTDSFDCHKIKSHM